MFKKTIIFLLFLVSLVSCKRDKGSSANSDYFPVYEYTLSNGLKVFLSVNKDAPRIQTAITVKAGSKYDPAQTTGLAHYLEHMLFKGSKQFGTINYEKEKPYLDYIKELYEKHKAENDPIKKKAIYKLIDSVSYEASKFAIPNEYDKMVSSIGAKGTNAFTDRDLTCYINDIPSNSVDKWLALESDRFQNLTLRIFHTELEAVYEEFNINTAYDKEWSSQAVDSLLMPNHPYGSQTTIGLSEHLKNPSLVNIQNYFDQYYVPNNCAIVMSGDLDPAKTFQLIEKHFGSWKSKNVPAFVKQPPVELSAPKETTKFGQEPEHVFIGYRFDGTEKKDWMKVKLIDMLLANGKGSGIIDLQLKLTQKVLEAYSMVSDNKDYTVHKLYGEPKEGQNLENVKDLLIAQIEEVKKGNFSEEDVRAVIDNLKLDLMRSTESNQGRTFDLVFAFVKDIPLAEKQKEITNLSKITKADLVKFANENYKQNYAVCYKRMGAPSLAKVEKPSITPVVLNKDSISAFRGNFEKMPTDQINAVFCNFDEQIKHSKLNSGIPVDYIFNEKNKTFQLQYVFDMGTNHNRKLGLALEYLPFMSTEDMTAAEIKQAFYKLGLEFNVRSDREECFITLSGLEENMEKGTLLFEKLLKNGKANQEVYNELTNDLLKKRMDAKLDKGTILWSGLFNYGKYGKRNPFNDVLTNDQLRSTQASELVQIVKQLCHYKHRIFYYGQKPLDYVTESLNKTHLVQSPLLDYPTPVNYDEKPIEESTVFFAHYPMKQAEVIFFSWDEIFNPSLAADAKMLNEYYGGNMSSIFFQELREKQALAYSVFGSYSMAIKKNDHNSVIAYIGTQSDKLPVAMREVNKLLNDLPHSETNFELSKNSLIKSLQADRITGEDIYTAYRLATKRGLNYDLRKKVFEGVQNIKFEDIKTFFDNHIKGKKYNYLVLGDRKDVDMTILKSTAPTTELSLTELFGY